MYLLSIIKIYNEVPMKIKLLIFMILALSFNLFAQEEDDETLISFGSQNGLFGGLVTKIGKINDETACHVGFRAGWIHDRNLILGAAVYALTNDVKALNSNPYDLTLDRMLSTYGGAEIEYVFLPRNAFHWSVQLLIGGGGVFYNYPNKDVKEDDKRDIVDGFFTLEPQVNFNVNLTHFLHADLGVSYRMVSGLKSVMATNSSMSSFNVIFTVRFGKF
jgi:hypothetical protein